MQVDRSPLQGPLKAAIETVVREAMASFGVRLVEIFEGEDHDGDPVLFVEVSHDLSRTPVDPGKLSVLLRRLSDELLQAGEKRFPIVRHHFAETQQVLGYR